MQLINQSINQRKHASRPHGQGRAIRSAPRPSTLIPNPRASRPRLRCNATCCDAMHSCSRQPSPACAVLFFARPRLSSSTLEGLVGPPALASAAGRSRSLGAGSGLIWEMSVFPTVRVAICSQSQNGVGATFARSNLLVGSLAECWGRVLRIGDDEPLEVENRLRGMPQSCGDSDTLETAVCSNGIKDGVDTR
jgi:hypothetical protein